VSSIISLQTYIVIGFFVFMFYIGFLTAIDEQDTMLTYALTITISLFFAFIWPASVPVFAGMTVASWGKQEERK
jgi:uncharacterized membrane protein YjgN (DUF898 family)